MKWPPIDVWRMSAGRVDMLEKTDGPLRKLLIYEGKLRYHLIESVVQPGASKECIRWAECNDYKVHVIDPAQGQGYAVNYALEEVIQSPYSLKWEDDFVPEVEIPLTMCVLLMYQYSHINQVCFNKRPTLGHKWADDGKGKRYRWYKEQRQFSVRYNENVIKVPLVVKEKWWFGSSVWKTSFIKPIFQWWSENTHNIFNDEVIVPMMDGGIGEDGMYPSPEAVEKYVGCYIYGKTKDPRMVQHIGLGRSLWSGEQQKIWAEQGKEIIGN